MSEDLIKRSDAIEMVGMLLDKADDVTDPDEQIELKAYNTGVQGAINMIKHHVPSADRPQGEWIAVSAFDAFGGDEAAWMAHGNPTAFHYCSRCKAQPYVNEFGEELLTDYCPNCGCRMKGADDE